MMRHPGLSILSAISVASFAAVVVAQPPSAQNESSPAEQARAAVARSKPQIVYNVRSRETAEALHAQSKPAGDVSLPIDPGMPISLQLSRSNANAEAAAARAVQPTPEPTAVPRVRRHKAQRAERIMLPPGQMQQPAFRDNPGHNGGKRGHGNGRGLF